MLVLSLRPFSRVSLGSMAWHTSTQASDLLVSEVLRRGGHLVFAELLLQLRAVIRKSRYGVSTWLRLFWPACNCRRQQV